MKPSAAATESDPVARVLLPVLLHEVNNATQLLVGLRAILELPGGESMFQKRVDDLGKTSATMDDLGFALAVIATAGGANMLLARRDARSMQILWNLASKALSRQQSGAAVQVTGPVPLTATDALDGWQLAWSVAAILIAALGDQGERIGQWTFEWTSESSGVQLTGTRTEGGTADECLGPALRSLLNERLGSDASVQLEGQSFRWRGASSLFQV